MKCEKQISYNRPAADLVLPESPELERAVLGALILEPELLVFNLLQRYKCSGIIP